jgi:glycerol kinase
MTKYILAIDQGTTSTRAMIFNHSGEVLGVKQKEHEQHYPKPGWVEHDPLEIWSSTQFVVQGVLNDNDLTTGDLAAIGITNQRETTLVWDRETGKPYYPAIVWQDTRTDKICNELAKSGGQDRFREITGLPLATYFSGPKVAWMLDNVSGLREKAQAGKAIFGTLIRG